MLMDILMEALMSMDEDTLDSVLESCSAEELGIIDNAVEATTEMSAKDRKDFDFINNIQRQASSKDGWAGVDKKDRDKFVDIMSKTKNLKVLKKAAKLGEREASHDSKVRNALAMIGSTAAGGIAGGLAVHLNENNPNVLEMKEKIKTAKKANDDAFSEAFKLRNNAYNPFNNTYDVEKAARADRAIDISHGADTYKNGMWYVAQYDDGGETIRNILGDTPANGAMIGSLAGAGLSAAALAAKKGIKNARDLKALKAQGENMTPNQRWKLNRKINELKGQK